MEENPYSAPKAVNRPAGSSAWPAKLFPPFLSSVVAITLGLLILGVQHRSPGFFGSARFLLPLIACSSISALILWPYRSANWLVRAVLAPPISFALFFLVIVMVQLVAA